MKVCVLGAGVVGVATAWSLSEAGYDVSIVDRHDGAAEETSKANACLLTPGHSLVWNSPAAPIEFAKSLFRRDPVMAIKLPRGLGALPWAVRFLLACGPVSVAERNRHMLRLALESADLTRRMAERLGLDLHMRSGGLLYWHRSAATLEADRRHAEFLNENGLDARILDRDALLALEPALADGAVPLVGALHVPEDMSADGRAFARQLFDRLPVGTFLRRTLLGARAEDGRIVAVETDGGTIEADHFVVALGAWSGRFLRKAGVRFPVAPAKGYSLTVPLNPGRLAPRIGGLDADELVTFAPLGGRLRISSYAHFTGYDQTWDAARFARHRRVAEETFPGLVDWDSDLQPWSGLRPMSPDGLPTVDRAPSLRNLWINAGHGYLGWTLAAVTAFEMVRLIDEQRSSESPFLRYRW